MSKKVFILYKHTKHDYTKLSADYERIILFDALHGAPDIHHIYDKLTSVFDSADVDNDAVVFSGPSYLCAIAGYIWLTNPKRQRQNFFAYNKSDGTYTFHDEEIGHE